MKNLTTRSLVYCIVILITSSICYAEIYQWRDKDGTLHFGDQPPQEAESETVKVKINSYNSAEVIDSSDWAEQREKESKNKRKDDKRVVMYSTQWCSACKKAKRYFTKNNIPYQEYDVERSERGQRDYAKLNGKGVPIILIGKKRMNGFNSSYFEAIYYAKK